MEKLLGDSQEIIHCTYNFSIKILFIGNTLRFGFVKYCTLVGRTFRCYETRYRIYFLYYKTKVIFIFI